MAKSIVAQTNSAVSQLQDQIETIRQEAYQEGYQAAMRAVIDFTGAGSPAKGGGHSASPKPKPTPKTTAPASSPAPASPRKARQAKPAARRRRTSPGDNARHIAEAMSTLPDRTGPAAAIRKALAAKGIDLAYATIRRALEQLQTRGEVSVSEDGRTWTATPAQAG